MDRRRFIKNATHSSLFFSAFAAPAFSAKRVLGANEHVYLGLIGCGGRGRFLARRILAVPNVEFAAASDVYEEHLASAKESFGPRCQGFKDFRDLLSQNEIDAVLIATPDHWHAIPTVLACEAGKDVYVEKPLAHNIREGQAMVEAARRCNRIVQAGTQQRSAPHFEEMRRIVQRGELGEIHYIRIWNFRNIFPRGIGRKSDSEPPAGLDWDFYLGPAPKVAFNWNRFLVNYRYFWDYSGGVITDFGTHRFDSMHHVMGVDSPLTVSASGRRFAVDDGGEIPDILQATYEYPGFVVSYEACLLNAHGLGGRTPGIEYYRATGKDDRPNGLAFYGTNGALFADRLGFEIYPESQLRQDARSWESTGQFRMQRKEASGEDATGLHVRQFIDCIKNRRKPIADVETGHRSAIVPHLGNIAYKTGKKLQWDGSKQEIVRDSEAAKLLGREGRKPWDLI